MDSVLEWQNGAKTMLENYKHNKNSQDKETGKPGAS